jgi:hypothetical protein
MKTALVKEIPPTIKQFEIVPGEHTTGNHYAVLSVQVPDDQKERPNRRPHIRLRFGSKAFIRDSNWDSSNSQYVEAADLAELAALFTELARVLEQ